MSYSLNGTDLSTYGFVATKAPKSNIALEGCWDFPSRLGKTFHDWGDEVGVEPYVDASEIFFGGRDLVLHGIIDGANESDAIAKCQVLYDVINTFDDLVPLATDWGTYQVMTKGQITSTMQFPSTVVMKIPFREPVVDLSGGDDAPDYVYEIGDPSDIPFVDGIDGWAFSELDMIVLSFKDYLNRPSRKPEEFAVYGSEGYEVTRAQQSVLTINLLLKSVDYTTFLNRIKSLFKLLKKEGTRHLTVGALSLGEFFAPNGFKVSQVMHLGSSFVGVVSIPIQFTSYGDSLLDALMDSDNELLLDNDDEILLDLIQ